MNSKKSNNKNNNNEKKERSKLIKFNFLDNNMMLNSTNSNFYINNTKLTTYNFQIQNEDVNVNKNNFRECYNESLKKKKNNLLSNTISNTIKKRESKIIAASFDLTNDDPESNINSIYNNAESHNLNFTLEGEYDNSNFINKVYKFYFRVTHLKVF